MVPLPIICLTQGTRLDRQKAFTKHARELGLEWQYFYSLPFENPYESFNHSQWNILLQMQIHETDGLVLEDDARFINTHLAEEIYSELPEDWDIFYLGANVKPHENFTQPVRISKNIFRIFNAYTTHAVAYRRSAIDYILQRYDGKQMYDAFLDEHVLRNLKTYICCPFLSIQTPVSSDLWNRTVDYTDTFNASQEYLWSLD